VAEPGQTGRFGLNARSIWLSFAICA